MTKRRETRGGPRPGSGRPRSPAATLAAITELTAALDAGSFRLKEWSEADLEAVVKAAGALAAPFRNELEQRWHEAGLSDE